MPLTLSDLARYLSDAKDAGIPLDSPLLLSSGKPGYEAMLTEISGATIWPVHHSPNGAGWCLRENSDPDPLGRPALVLTVGKIGVSGAWGLRTNENPHWLYLVAAKDAPAYVSSLGIYGKEPTDTLYGPPVALTSYQALMLYLARDEQDTTTPNIEQIHVPKDDGEYTPGFWPTVAYLCSLNAAVHAQAMYALRKNHGAALFGEERKEGGTA